MSAKPVLFVVIASLAFVAGCDQREERLERLNTLTNATIDQVTGQTPTEPPPPPALRSRNPDASPSSL